MRAFVRVLEAGAFTRVALRGSVGLLRAYKDREIEVSDIGAFAQVLMHNTKGLAAHESVLGVLQWMGGAMLYSELVHEHSNVDSGYIAAELQVDQLGMTFTTCNQCSLFSCSVVTQTMCLCF